MKITFSSYDYQARFDMTREEMNDFRKYVYTYCKKNTILIINTHASHTPTARKNNNF